MEKTTPVINYKAYHQHCERLDKSIKNADERNVAISGIYGSGKSSLIRTYEKGYNNKKTRNIIKKYSADKNSEAKIDEILENSKYKPIKKSMYVSLANFNIKNKVSYIEKIKNDDLKTNNEQTNKSDNNTVEDSQYEFEKNKIIHKIKTLEQSPDAENFCLKEDLIEKNLLQQFIFNQKPYIINDSHIKKVEPRTVRRFFSYISFISIIIFVAIVLINNFNILWNYSKNINTIFLILSGASFIIFLSFLPLTFTFAKIKTEHIEIINPNERSESSLKDSLINKYMDEIIYFFKKSKYKIIYFEDMDRLPNLNIFNKLRELNFLLNNTKILKKKITFVYCISDSIFSNYEERSKFFECIITVTPHINSDIVKNQILKELRKHISEKDSSKFEEYSINIAPFILDSRLLYSIKNDFILMLKNYKKVLNRVITDIELIKIFTLSIYKNYYYFDYNKLTKNDSVLCDVFKLIRMLKKDALTAVENEILLKETELKNSKNNEYASFKILKERMCGIYSSLLNYERNISSSVKIMNSKIEDYIEGKYFSLNSNYAIAYEHFNNYFITNYNYSLQDYINHIKLKNEDDYNEKLNELARLRNKKTKINNSTISEFLSEFDCDKIPNKFFNVCFKNGYIENDYMKYIYANSSEDFLPEQDNAFIRYNNYGETNSPIKNNFHYQLSIDRLDTIISNIFADKFKYNKILNINLVTHIIRQNNIKSQYKNNLFELLNETDEKVLEFYKEFLITQNYEDCKLIFFYFINSYFLLDALLITINQIEPTKRHLLFKYILSELDFNILSKNNKKKLEKIINYYDNWKDIQLTKDQITKFNDLYNIKIVKLDSFDNDSLKEIIDNNLFEINFSNLEIISSRICFNKNYNLILNSILLSDISVNCKEYLFSNINLILEFLNNQTVDPNVLKNILKHNEDLELQKNIISMLSFEINDISELSKDSLNLIIDANKVSNNISTLFDIYKTIDINVISKYFEIESFSNIDFSDLNKCTEDDQYKEFRNKIFHRFYLAENNVEILKMFDLSISTLGSEQQKDHDSRLSNLANNNLIEFKSENLDFLNNCPKTYLSLVNNNSDQYFSLLKGSKITLTKKIITHLICFLNNFEVINFLLNNHYNLIDFNYQYENIIETSEILNKIYKHNIQSGDVIVRLFDNSFQLLNYRDIIQKIVIKNNNLFSDSALQDLFFKLDESYKKIINKELTINEINNKFLTQGIKCLESRKIIEP